MNKWRIKTRRDWAIAAGFLFLLSYLIVAGHQVSINEWLMNFSPEKMTYFNQPESHGVCLLAVCLAAVFWTVLWVWQKRTEKTYFWKGLLAMWGLAAVLAGVIWFAYQSECRQIVNTPSTGLKADVRIFSWDIDLPEPLELTEEEQQELLELCLNLTAPSKEEQEILRARTDEKEEISIDIQYPEYKNHSYNLWFFLEEDVIRLNRGHNSSEAVYYDGTEVRALVEEILEAHR